MAIDRKEDSKQMFSELAVYVLGIEHAIHCIRELMVNIGDGDETATYNEMAKHFENITDFSRYNGTPLLSELIYNEKMLAGSDNDE